MAFDDKFTILLVEDDENDSILLQRALKKNAIGNPVVWMKDGMAALEYLTGKGQYSDRIKHPFPRVIILDLKMPRMSGLELLQYLHDNPNLKVIPTIVLSSSRLSDDIEKSYSLGANTYFVKPADANGLAIMIKTFIEYWSLGEKPEPKAGKSSSP